MIWHSCKHKQEHKQEPEPLEVDRLAPLEAEMGGYQWPFPPGVEDDRLLQM